MFGSPWRPAQEWEQGSFLEGAAWTLFSLKSGILVIAPAIIVAFAAWPALLSSLSARRDGADIGDQSPLRSFCHFMETRVGASYAARYMVPILPLLFVSLASLPDAKLWQMRYMRHGIIGLCAVSVVINGIAAMPYWKYWDSILFMLS